MSPTVLDLRSPAIVDGDRGGARLASLLRTMAFSYPLMAGIQEISARIGLVTGRGLAANLRTHFPPALLYAVVFLLLVANVINIGADRLTRSSAG